MIFKEQADIREEFKFVNVEDYECLKENALEVESEAEQEIVIFKNGGLRMILFEGIMSPNRFYSFLATHKESSLAEYDSNIAKQVF